MPKHFRWKTLFIATITVCIILLLLLCFVLRPAQVSRALEVRIADTPEFSNGVFVASVVLSNGTPQSLNIIDDTAGKPLFVLDAGVDYYPAGSRAHGGWLAPAANTLKLNLPPGASLTNSVRVTNPPPRFRLKAITRDLAAEGRNWWVVPVARRLPQRWSEKLERRLEMPMPSSDWIEIKMTTR